MPFGEWNAGLLLNCCGVGALPAEPGFQHVLLTLIRNTPTTGEGTWLPFPYYKSEQL